MREGEVARCWTWTHLKADENDPGRDCEGAARRHLDYVLVSRSLQSMAWGAPDTAGDVGGNRPSAATGGTLERHSPGLQLEGLATANTAGSGALWQRLHGSTGT